MARAVSIWIVTEDWVGDHALVAAFTVKHELVSWAKKQDSLSSYVCYRLPDNPTRHRPVEIEYINLEKLL